MHGRRTTIALALVALLLTSGCLGFLTGEESISFESGTVSVSENARSDTGYSQARRERQTVQQNFSVAGQTRTVEVRNHVAEYKRQVSLPALGDQELARFTVMATPKVRVLNRTFNPVGDLSNRELALRLQETYTTMSNVQAVGDRTVTVLGEETTVTKFSAEAQIEGGQSADVYLHIAQSETEDDFLVFVAVYPQQLDEQSNVDRLLEGAQHQPQSG